MNDLRMPRAITPEESSRFERLFPHGSVHSPLPGLTAIGETELEEYRRCGFLAVENVLSADEVATAREALDDLVLGRVPSYRLIEEPSPELYEVGVDGAGVPPEERFQHLRRLVFFVKHEPRLAAVSRHRALLSVVSRLVGDRVRLLIDTAFLKPPHGVTDKPWHQDAAYLRWQPFGGVIGTWTALDDANPENGCMHVVPGSHLEGPIAHYHDRDCQIPDERVDVDSAIAVPLHAGGTLFFHALLHHGTPPNRTRSLRRALGFHYASVQCHPVDVDHHSEVFFDEDGYAGCNPKTGRPVPAHLRQRPLL